MDLKRPQYLYCIFLSLLVAVYFLAYSSGREAGKNEVKKISRLKDKIVHNKVGHKSDQNQLFSKLAKSQIKAKPSYIADLFDSLYETNRPADSQKVLDFIQKRFENKYPNYSQGKHHDSYRSEMVSRIGILKAINQGYLFKTLKNKKIATKLKEIYLGIIENSEEPWLVQRQALQNISKISFAISKSERRRILVISDSRAIASAKLTEQELVEEFLGNAVK